MRKEITRWLDSTFLNGAYRNHRVQAKRRKQFDQVALPLGYQITSFYSKDHSQVLASLCDRYGSDKGSLLNENRPYRWAAHTYSDFYTNLFFHCRFGVKAVFECGLGTNNPAAPSSMGTAGKTGASLRMWRDYFPNAVIYGADIDRDILFEEDRIRTYYMDQTSPEAITAFWNSVEKNNFDLMVDDGLHTFDAGSTLFINSIDKLSPTGVYVIEDVTVRDLLRYKEFFLEHDYLVSFLILERPEQTLNDNCLVVVRKQS